MQTLREVRAELTIWGVGERLIAVQKERIARLTAELDDIVIPGMAPLSLVGGGSGIKRGVEDALQAAEAERGRILREIDCSRALIEMLREKIEAVDRVQTTLAKPGETAVIILKYRDGLSWHEAAKRMHTSQSTIRRLEASFVRRFIEFYRKMSNEKALTDEK
jgi:predicted DNA-binding protein (UPF0251 family)